MPKDSSKVAKIVLLRDNKVLLLKTAFGTFEGHWDLPGGHIHEDEKIIDGLVREVKEETNLDVSSIQKINFSYKNKFFFKGPMPDGKIFLSDEHNEHKLFTIKELQNINITSYFKEVIMLAVKKKGKHTMKITKQRLKEIIKEELESLLEDEHLEESYMGRSYEDMHSSDLQSLLNRIERKLNKTDEDYRKIRELEKWLDRKLGKRKSDFSGWAADVPGLTEQ
jgi:8-oxo-dGTP pyrophosphatase MutT (NUDIX family)